MGGNVSSASPGSTDSQLLSVFSPDSGRWIYGSALPVSESGVILVFFRLAMFDEATFLKGVAEWGQFPDEGRPEVAFMGRSNVGKSSLINAVLTRKSLAYTSKSPGKTRQFNFFLIDRCFFLVDLPGYGFAKGSRSEQDAWERLRERYLEERRPLCGVVQLVDARHPPMDSDVAEIERMEALDLPHLLALTKADKLSGNGRAKAKRRFAERLGERSVVVTSAETGRGISEVRTWVGSAVERMEEDDSPPEPSWMNGDSN